jgi:hypothetical protein
MISGRSGRRCEAGDMGEVTGGNNTIDTIQEVGDAQPCYVAFIGTIPSVHVFARTGESPTIVQLLTMLLLLSISVELIATKYNCLVANPSVYNILSPFPIRCHWFYADPGPAPPRQGSGFGSGMMHHLTRYKA